MSRTRTAYAMHLMQRALEQLELAQDSVVDDGSFEILVHEIRHFIENPGRLGPRIVPPKPWTTHERAWLRANYQSMPAKEQAARLNRSLGSIYSMGYELKLSMRTRRSPIVKKESV